MFKRIVAGVVLALSLALAPVAAQAQSGGGSVSDTFAGEDIIKTGGEFFGSVSQGLASLVERATSQFGLPNAYILGEEAGGAFFAGARYGEGTMYTRNQGEHPIFWQGPTVGLDFGGDGSKVMMLVYNLSSVQEAYNRFPGLDGSAYVVGGLGMTVLKSKNVVVVPIRSGVGLRAGLNVGYLKFTDQPTWNPF